LIDPAAIALAIGRMALFAAGVACVVAAVMSALRTFVLPRSAIDLIPRLVFRALRLIFEFRVGRARSFRERDAIMAMFAPFGLFALPVAWLTIVQIGFTMMFLAEGAASLTDAFRLSGSSLFTLGFATPGDSVQTLLAFAEALIGIVLSALLIAYLPTMYAAFARREVAVTMLEVRAGSPPSPVEMFARHARLLRLDSLGDLWAQWEVWFADLEESHTSLGALAFFRSPRPEHSWVTAAGAVLDSAGLAVSTIDIPADPRANLALRAGYLALRRVCDFFNLDYDEAPRPDDPISITRAEWDAACDAMQAQGVPLKPDRDQCWRDWSGWRVNYDVPLLLLAGLTMAPPAPWSSDRAPRRVRAGMRSPRRNGTASA
jgi:hypothetical protein